MGWCRREDDLKDLVTMFAYRPEASTYPISTREGMLKRKLGWMETLVTCDYTKVRELYNTSSRAWSVSKTGQPTSIALLKDLENEKRKQCPGGSVSKPIARNGHSSIPPKPKAFAPDWKR